MNARTENAASSRNRIRELSGQFVLRSRMVVMASRSLHPLLTLTEVSLYLGALSCGASARTWTGNTSGAGGATGGVGGSNASGKGGAGHAGVAQGGAAQGGNGAAPGCGVGLQAEAPWPMRGRCEAHPGLSPFGGPSGTNVLWQYTTRRRLSRPARWRVTSTVHIASLDKKL